jgi:hypothetical protein
LSSSEEVSGETAAKENTIDPSKALDLPWSEIYTAEGDDIWPKVQYVVSFILFFFKFLYNQVHFEND